MRHATAAAVGARCCRCRCCRPAGGGPDLAAAMLVLPLLG